MSQNDEVAKERIEILESQLQAADIENDELKQDLFSLKVELQRLISDRSYCP